MIDDSQPMVFMARGGRCSGESLTFNLDENGVVTGFRAAGFAYIHLLDPSGQP